MLLGNSKDVLKYVENNKISTSEFVRIIINTNIRCRELNSIYEISKYNGFFADMVCFKRLLNSNKFNKDLFINFVIDIVSNNVENLFDIAREILQHKTNKINLLIDALNEFYVAISMDMYHKISQYKSDYDNFDLLVLLRNKIIN